MVGVAAAAAVVVVVVVVVAGGWERGACTADDVAVPAERYGEN